MLRGDGALVVATRRGVRLTGLPVTAPATPDPLRWAHDCACAWTAAWLTVRGARDWSGPREVLTDPTLKGSIEWRTRTGVRHSGHRPDLTVASPAGTVVIEVELQRKETARITAILSMYRDWIACRRLAGVAYICGTQARAESIGELAANIGIPRSSLRLELLSDVRAEAEAGMPARRSA